jgi:hypothetical protein
VEGNDWTEGRHGGRGAINSKRVSCGCRKVAIPTYKAIAIVAMLRNNTDGDDHGCHLPNRGNQSDHAANSMGMYR